MNRLRFGCATLAIILLAAGAAVWTAPGWLLDGIAALAPGCLYRAQTTSPVVALTIDDGPDSVSTPAILRQLRREKATATFFLIATRIAGREAVVRALVNEGHELGNHFSLDRPSIRLAPGELEDDLLSAHRVLTRFGRVTWARPGSGWYSRHMIDTMQQHGYRCALGSVYPFDVAIPWPSFSSWYVLRNVRPGAVVVLHDGGKRGRRTVEVLKRVLPELRRRGYRVVTLTRLVEGG